MKKFLTKLVCLTALFLVPCLALASGYGETDLGAVEEGGNLLTNILMAVAFAALTPTVMYQLYLVKVGHKELLEAAKPILVTALIVCTPPVISSFISAIRSGWGV
jgi:hypothetical protein